MLKLPPSATATLLHTRAGRAGRAGRAMPARGGPTPQGSLDHQPQPGRNTESSAQLAAAGKQPTAEKNPWHTAHFFFPLSPDARRPAPSTRRPCDRKTNEHLFPHPNPRKARNLFALTNTSLPIRLLPQFTSPAITMFAASKIQTRAFSASARNVSFLLFPSCSGLAFLALLALARRLPPAFMLQLS